MPDAALRPWQAERKRPVFLQGTASTLGSESPHHRGVSFTVPFPEYMEPGRKERPGHTPWPLWHLFGKHLGQVNGAVLQDVHPQPVAGRAEVLGSIPPILQDKDLHRPVGRVYDPVFPHPGPLVEIELGKAVVAGGRRGKNLHHQIGCSLAAGVVQLGGVAHQLGRGPSSIGRRGSPGRFEEIVKIQKELNPFISPKGVYRKGTGILRIKQAVRPQAAQGRGKRRAGEVLRAVYHQQQNKERGLIPCRH